MKGCIVCNSNLDDCEFARESIADCELVIAADGGSKHLVKMDIVPNVIIGDIDSIDKNPWHEKKNTERQPLCSC